MFKNTVEILDTTLRDGSYVIDFQFTISDTEIITQCLQKIGIPFIEIGHGLGINASLSKGKAAASDIEYIQAARAHSHQSKIGMFCIPGIAKIDDLKACAKAGLQFVRIGVNVNEVKNSESFIKCAKDLGLFVCSNFMKSYALPPEKFAQIAKLSCDYGSDLVYLVDSAGGMIPDEVTTYITELKKVVKVPIGFHGHNNLNLVVANSLAAAQAGAQLVDTTLLGMGRSSGNAPLEVMVPLLQRFFKSYLEINPSLLIELADRLISPLLKNRWEDSEKTALGLSQVHSMYIPEIKKAVTKNKKLLYSTICEIGKIDRLNLTEKTLNDALSKSLTEENFKQMFGEVSIVEKIDHLSSQEDIFRLALKLNIPVLLEVTRGERNVYISHNELVFRCDSEEALKFLDFKNSIIIKLIFDSRSIETEHSTLLNLFSQNVRTKS